MVKRLNLLLVAEQRRINFRYPKKDGRSNNPLSIDPNFIAWIREILLPSINRQ